mmetsp:Transcript_15127/g.20284  ORF Transcript_15127/g.20284 Transcript_15127/m.20284 type:complete len:298 (-) Transcript_15127:202-1095(-)
MRLPLFVLAFFVVAQFQHNILTAQAKKRKGSDEVTKKSKKKKSKGGVLMWALGRSSTGTWAHSFSETCSLKFCNSEKEGFKSEDIGVLSPKSLRKCRKSGHGFTHVKPKHIISGSMGTLRTPEAFMKSIRDVGFTVVVVIRRQNHLARLISSFELSKDYKSHTPLDFDRIATLRFSDIIHSIQLESKVLERGVRAAKAEGLCVHVLDFVEVTQRLCKTIFTVAADVPSCSDAVERGACMSLSEHKTRRGPYIGFRERLGKRAFESVEAQLHGTPYEWMLNESAVAWPVGVRNPVPFE